MKRVIVDYSKLNTDILDLLVRKFPDGYDEDDVITFRNAQNEIVEAVEVRTEETVYLVKVSKRLANTMENHEENEDDDDLYDDTESSVATGEEPSEEDDIDY